jgi:hypothetical protein
MFRIKKSDFDVNNNKVDYDLELNRIQFVCNPMPTISTAARARNNWCNSNLYFWPPSANPE